LGITKLKSKLQSRRLSKKKHNKNKLRKLKIKTFVDQDMSDNLESSPEISSKLPNRSNIPKGKAFFKRKYKKAVKMSIP